MHPIDKDGYSRGVGVFIIQDGRLLLTFRSKGEQPGVWEVVAGHIKAGESAEGTAIREALEETGLTIRITEHLSANVDDAHKFVAEMVVAEVVSGDAKNLDERHHSAVEWFDLEALPEPLGSTTLTGLEMLRKRG